MDHYIRNEDEDLPPIDRFNLGQKYFFWAMSGAAGSSGVGRDPVVPGSHSVEPALPAYRDPAARASALVTIGAFIIHVYMGTAVVRGGFTSIIRGEVSPAWARLHHRLWYDRVAGK